MSQTVTPEEYQAMLSKPKRSKYGAAPTVYNGVRYASKAEAGWAEAFDQVHGSPGHGKCWYLRQPRFTLGVAENIYVPDFLVVLLLIGGEPEDVYAVDVKGVETAKFRRDCKLWAAYGPCPLHIVKRKGAKYVTDRVIEGKRP